MPVVRQLHATTDAQAAASLWREATIRRRHELGLEPLPEADVALSRPGAFAVGVAEGHELLSLAAAVPARADDARSVHNVPGLVHISSVATRPDQWGTGLAGRCVRAAMWQATRRGFARAQLWTHTSNAGSRRLYEREGFEASGRHKLDDHGEPMLHYVRELPVAPRVARRAARLVCLDPQDRVLVLHWRDPLDGFPLWEPPGGGIEPGETAYDAVLREWREETGLPVPTMSGAATPVARDMLFEGRRGVVDEDFFLGRTAEPGTPVLDGATAQEQTDYLGSAWVPWDQLAALEDAVEPDLLPVLRRLDPLGPWAP
ncbi:MAG: GNAT family N-acetyltransferase [Nocardioidaceae bacterium]